MGGFFLAFIALLATGVPIALALGVGGAAVFVLIAMKHQQRTLNLRQHTIEVPVGEVRR